MSDENAGSMESELLREFRSLLLRSIVKGSEAEKQRAGRDTATMNILIQLDDFVDKNGNAKEWLRARCLESVVASGGLNEYLKTLLSFRDGSPSEIAPLNIMFASSQIARALDPIVIKLLRELDRKRLEFPPQKMDALISILNPMLNFTVAKTEVYFYVEEVERLRNLLLKMALDRFYPRPTRDYPRSMHKLPELKSIGTAPKISLKRLIDVSKEFANLDISVSKGILRWQYGTEPALFIKDGICFYDQLEVDSKRIGYTSVKRQFNLMKKAMSTTRNK